MNNMENIIEETTKKLAEELNAKFEQALIDACMKKGFVLNKETAPDFTEVEFQGWKTLIHTLTNTPICKYSTIPKITTGWHNEDITNKEYALRADIEFTEL